MALGVTKYNPLAQDPDYPQTPSSVKSASAITNPGSSTAVTSQFPSMPIPGQVVYDANGIAIPDYAAKTRGAYELGLGQNDTLSQAWYNIDPTKTQFGGATTPKPVVSSTKTGGIGGTGGTGGMTATEALALAKFNYDKQQDAQKLGGMQSYYDSGSVNTGFDKLLKMIGDQGTVSQDAVKGAYDKAITNVDQGYAAAQGLGDSGYDALNKYLAANQNNPYAGMQATVGSAPDALTQYLSAYGVSDQPVQGQIRADQLQAQQGAGNYQNLINVLGSVAQMGASSRGAESAMGQNLFNTTLGQERAGYKTKAEMAQADAMRQIQEIMYQQRMAQESARNAQLQQLAAALAAAGGNPGGGGGGGGGSGSGNGNGNGNRNNNGATETATVITPQLLEELNARRGYVPTPAPIQVDPEEERRRGIAEAMAARRGY